MSYIHKYVLHEGWIIREDCSEEYISWQALKRLYNLENGEYVVAEHNRQYPEHWTHLYPRLDYKYDLEEVTPKAVWKRRKKC